MTAGSPRLRRLSIQILLTLILLLPAELVVAWRESSKESRTDTITGEYMPIRLIPRFDGIVGGQAFSTNNLGFRDTPDVDIGAPPPGQRILVLGDSISFGFGLAPEETYPARLQDLLTESSPGAPAQVLNASGQGYSPSSYWAYVAHEGFLLEPDVVIVQVEFSNDVSDEALLSVHTRPDRLPAVRGGRYVVTWDGNLIGVPIFGPYFHEKTYLYGAITGNLLTSLGNHWPVHGPLADPRFTYYSIGPDRVLLDEEAIDGGRNRLWASMRALRDLTRQEGIRFLILPTPNRYWFEEAEPASHEFSRFLFEQNLKAAQFLGLEIVDAREVLARAGGNQLYLDFAHLNSVGHQILAEALHRRLR